MEATKGMPISEQQDVYNCIMKSVLSNYGGFYFLYEYDGTGKTFIWNTLSTALRSRGLVVLNMASNGINSLLLPGGRTTHSKFCIPLAAHEISTCNIKQGSLRAKLLIETSLIIWDEATMMNRFYFEALDHTLRNLMKIKSVENVDKPFGGKVVILGGDFRQILPVICGGNKQDIIDATINASHLWKDCKVLRLIKNMRLSTTNNVEEANEIKEYAYWILSIGNGHPEHNEFDESFIEIPPNLLTSNFDNSLM
ncbi:hypothetical protein RJT34_20061 [Clitoria ternatea]|uniref:ATP-dependent DNA helicase n=1 Tax=Clitoria ternatea TaxID=43366 RepID=A0AAN9IS66_CLITE